MDIMDRPRPNLLLMTADDMNWDAVGAYGCAVPGTTPHLDRMAREGIRFDHAHVTIAVCQPSRSAIMTGRYPHRSGGEGFFHLRHPDIPILPAILRQAGYRVGILGKVPHSTPYAGFAWDLAIDREDLGEGRNPAIYVRETAEFIRAATNAGKPWFLMVNSHDPHRPFVGNDDPEWYSRDDDNRAVPPSRSFEPPEVHTPGFLPDLPDVRREIAEYYSSVRRCDDTMGAVLEVLDRARQAADTLALFLSDNGMAFPYAKTNCYLHSTRTPWIARWPRMIEASSHDTRHFVSGIDILPTFLEAAGIDAPGDIDGHSFLPLLKGESQQGRDTVFTQFHQNAGRFNFPMRCIQTRQFGYIYNPWSDGLREFRNESMSGRTMAAMRTAAEIDPAIARRVDFFIHRVPEELYHFQNDPDALNNCIDDQSCSEEVADLRGRLEAWMEQTADPALEAFRNRESSEAREAFLRSMDAEIGGR